MIRPSRWLSRLVLVLASALGVGSVVAFAGWPLGTLRLVGPDLPEAGILAWDAALSLLFFLQHSGMIRRNVRAGMARVIDPVYLPGIYTIASGLALLAVTLFWQPSHVSLVSLFGPARIVAHGFSVGAFGLFIWGLIALRSFDPLGVRIVAGHLRGAPPKPCAFVARGAYRWVRHPLYLAVIALIWACPDVTTDRLLFNVLWTAWIVVGTLLEEADLLAELGETYRQYQRTVPMLLPWTKVAGRLDPAEQRS